MGQIGKVHGGFEQFTGEGRLGIALVPVGGGAVLDAPVGDIAVPGGDLLIRSPLGAAVVPLDAERLASLAGGPGVLRDDGDARRDGEDVHDAGDASRVAVVEPGQASADSRRVGHHGGQHVRQTDVLGVDRGARALVTAVETADPPGADQGELVRRLEGRLLRRLEGRGGPGEFAEPRRTSGGRMTHDPVRDRQAVCRNAPPGCGRLDQHRTGRGAHLAHAFPRLGNRSGAGGHLGPVHRRIRRSGLHADPVPVGVELLRHDGGEAGMDALTHFLEGVGDDDGPVGLDAKIGAEGAVLGPNRAGAEDAGDVGPRRAEHQGAAHDHPACGENAATREEPASRLVRGGGTGGFGLRV
jgi:hypothetical protein